MIINTEKIIFIVLICKIIVVLQDSDFFNIHNHFSLDNRNVKQINFAYSVRFFNINI